MHTKPVLISAHPIEAQLGNLYTQVNFLLFQDELKVESAYVAKKLPKLGDLVTYSVQKYSNDGKTNIVEFTNANEVTAKCSCKKFEYEGILCRHILSIFRKKMLTKCSDKYILPRWTINARYGTISRVTSMPVGNELTSMMIWSLRSSTLKVEQ